MNGWDVYAAKKDMEIEEREERKREEEKKKRKEQEKKKRGDTCLPSFEHTLEQRRQIFTVQEFL